MSTRQQPLYEIRIKHLLQSVPGESPATYSTFFTNLKKAIETLSVTLEANGWPVPISYTTIYRHLQLKGIYNYTYSLEEVRYFKLTVVKHVVNPNLTTMGIEEMPRPRRGTS